MIGQTKIIATLTDLKESKKLPNLLILEGPVGSGKKTLLKSLFPSAIYPDNLSVDGIRNLISISYTVKNQIFIIPDGDNLSVAAQNALLKVVEEGVNTNRFILTVISSDNVLRTIQSRGHIYTMDKYIPQELLQYAGTCIEIKELADHSCQQMILNLCETPGDIDLLVKYGLWDFYNYVKLVVDHIGTVSGSNSFKIASKVALKDADTGYDLTLFWKAAIPLFRDKAFTAYFDNNDISTATAYDNIIAVTHESLSLLRKRGINRPMLMDRWILKVREQLFSIE